MHNPTHSQAIRDAYQTWEKLPAQEKGEQGGTSGQLLRRSQARALLGSWFSRKPQLLSQGGPWAAVSPANHKPGARGSCAIVKCFALGTH